MSYGNGEIIEVLRAARQARQLSQRALSAKAGVPQSHISKIENGGSDIRLSSLIELARALELELVLVPRRLLPAVQGILRSSPAQLTGSRDSYPQIADALKILARLAEGHPSIQGLGELQQLVRELGNLRLSPLDLTRIRTQVTKLSEVGVPADDHPVLAGALRTLSSLRNQLAHAVSPAPKPAYSLDDDDDD